MVNPEFQTHVLPNGLRIIHAWMPREVTHCALVVNAGTRDEGEGEAGLAHFIEHVLFKGTQKRKAFHILNRMESVGGEINAYTCLLYTSPSPRDQRGSRMPSSA